MSAEPPHKGEDPAQGLTPETANQVDEKGNSWLLTQILHGSSPVPTHLWIPKHARRQNNFGWCPVSALIHKRRTHEIPEIGKWLINENEDGENPLHWCAKWGYLQETEFFLAKGANPLARDKAGQRPREIAVQSQPSPEAGEISVEVQAIIHLLEKEERRRTAAILRNPAELEM